MSNGPSNHYSELIEAFNGSNASTYKIHARRAVKLSEDLRTIESRRLECIEVRIYKGSSFDIYELNRDDASMLVRALNAALAATEKDEA